MLKIGDSGLASELKVGHRFIFLNQKDKKEHVITSDMESHFLYDNKPNKILSKAEIVKRIGEANPNEDLEHYQNQLESSLKDLENTGDIGTFLDRGESSINYLASLEKGGKVADNLLKIAIDVFSDAPKRHGKSSIQLLDRKKRQEYQSAKEQAFDLIRSNLSESIIREVISEIIQKCGSKWCLKSKKTGKILGKHDTKSDAEKQEIAIQISKSKR